jgi:hypothetical protein
MGQVVAAILQVHFAPVPVRWALHWKNWQWYRVFSEYFHFPHVNTVTPLLCVLISTGGQGLGTLKQSSTLLDVKDHGTEMYFHIAGMNLQMVDYVLL